MNTLPKNAVVRLVKSGDAAEIANVHLNSWREAYRDLMPDDYLDQLPLSFKRRMNNWSQVINEMPKGQQIWVADSQQDGIIGFSTVGIARDDHYKEYGELRAIYLLKQYKNAGIGHELLKIAFSYLKCMGYSKAYCWVLKDNPTISFYKRTGANLTEDIKIDPRDSLQLTEIACVWDLHNF
jgi:ribosomal protein S18 acetylase RimI-like enzyme